MSFWTHSVTQLLALPMIYVFGGSNQWFLEMKTQFAVLLAPKILPSFIFVWLLFTFLLTELLVRQLQRSAAKLFPNSLFGFRLFQILLIPVALFVTWIAIECMVFLAVTGHYAKDFGPIRFSEGFGLTLWSELPLMVVFLLAELIRQIVFSSSLKS